MTGEMPLVRPGESAGWPKLVLRYPTESAALAALLPPGLEPRDEPTVQVNVYCVPVHGEPEYGLSTKIPARFQGIDGFYSLGIGIDQESAIFVSRETNGQPKFPCRVRFFRLAEVVDASATHQGVTFLSYRGTSGDLATAGTTAVGDEVDDDEFWIKVSRAVGGVERAYDLPPQVVRVRTTGVVTHVEPMVGELVLRDSRWDPYTTLLPMVGAATAELVTTRHTGRAITAAGPLDPDAFWPFVDTIGGSRWPGAHGGPR